MGTREGAVVIKTLASEDVPQPRCQEIKDSRTKWGRAFSQLIAFASPALLFGNTKFVDLSWVFSTGILVSCTLNGG